MLDLLSDLLLGLILILFFRQAFDYFYYRKTRMYRKRLRTVYELLESGNNRKVIAEVDKLIADTQAPAAVKDKKRRQHPVSSEPGYDEQVTLVIGKALKCLAMMRTGRRVESDLLMGELLDSYTTDENALQVIMQYCKETHQADKIAYFYERAVKKYEETSKQGTAEHEELLATLFYAYVRLVDFSKQQQVALKLYKMTNNISYCFWNAASYVMMAQKDVGKQAGDNQHQRQKDMYLQLGEKILCKAYEDKKMEYNGEFLMYLNILESKSKFTDCLTIINDFDEAEHASNLGQIDFKVRRKITYFHRLKKWDALRFLCEQFITEPSATNNIDDWLIYQTYLTSLVNLYTDQKDPELKQTLIADALAFFSNLLDAKVQSPYLAKIDLLSQLTLLDPSLLPSQLETIKAALTTYIRQFVAKPGFYYDFIYFKDLISRLNLEEFVLNECHTLYTQAQPFKTVKCVYTAISYWTLHRQFGKQHGLDKVQTDTLCTQLEASYKEALPFGADLLPTSMQFADELLILSVHLKYNHYPVTHLITLLKQGLSNSPSNYQFKLLLLNLYSQLGCFTALNDTYKSMEIKNIQNYSTANLLLAHNLRLGSVVSSIATYTTIGHFFLSNLFDMANFLVHCYKYGSFLKAIEIYEFIGTIKRSLTLNLCLANFVTISFVMQSTNLSPTHVDPAPAKDQAANTDEDVRQDFKILLATVNNHIKQLSNVSSVFDPITGLLPDDISCLLDHHDKDVLYNWDPSKQKETFQLQYDVNLNEQRTLLKLRNLMIRYMFVFLKLNLEEASLSPDQAKESKDNLSLYRSKLTNFSEFNFNYQFDDSAISDEDYFDSKLTVLGTKSFYLSRWSQLGLDKVVKVFTSLSSEFSSSNCADFLAREVASEQAVLKEWKNELKEAFKKLSKGFDEVLGYEGQLGKTARVIECFSASVECVSFVVILLSMSLCNDSLKPIWTEKMKKSKKKKGQYVQNAASIDILSEIFETLCQLIGYLEAKIETALSKVEATCSTCDHDEIGKSFSKSFEEIKSILSAKLKYLLKFTDKSSLKLELEALNLK